MTVRIYRYIQTTTLYYWPNTTGMPHLKISNYLPIHVAYHDGRLLLSTWYGCW